MKLLSEQFMLHLLWSALCSIGLT